MSNEYQGHRDGFRVLVVEDNRGVRRMLRFSLRDAGFQVFDVASGREALQILEQQTLEAVVLDLGLSDHRGRDVLDWLRRRGSDGNGQLPVWVVMSALDRDDATRQYGQLGSQFLAKPFDPWMLVGILQKLLEEVSGILVDHNLDGRPATSSESADGNAPHQPMK